MYIYIYIWTCVICKNQGMNMDLWNSEPLKPLAEQMTCKKSAWQKSHGFGRRGMIHDDTVIPLEHGDDVIIGPWAW